jgi:hypothetical protein
MVLSDLDTTTVKPGVGRSAYPIRHLRGSGQLLCVHNDGGPKLLRPICISNPQNFSIMKFTSVIETLLPRTTEACIKSSCLLAPK